MARNRCIGVSIHERHIIKRPNWLFWNPINYDTLFLIYNWWGRTQERPNCCVRSSIFPFHFWFKSHMQSLVKSMSAASTMIWVSVTSLGQAAIRFRRLLMSQSCENPSCLLFLSKSPGSKRKYWLTPYLIFFLNYWDGPKGGLRWILRNCCVEWWGDICQTGH
jgi:hypothetical protein